MTKLTTFQFPFIDEPVKQYTCDNGHRIVLIRKPGEISNVSTWVKTGSINENDENNGVSHFLEHLMFKGTERLKPGDFDRMLESRGGMINAATWKDYTFYYVTIPNGDNNENLKLAIDLHADMILNSTLPDEEIGPCYDINNPNVTEKRERSVVIEEIGMREDQSWTKTYNNLNAMMYKAHPYRYDTIGTRQIIASIPRQKILEYYKAWYVPENMITIVVSDNDNDEILELVKSHFKFSSSNPSPESEYTFETPVDQTAIKEVTGDVTTGYMIIGFHGPLPSNLKDSIAIQVASIILGEGRSSRLHQNLIEKPANSLFNMVSCTQYQFRDGNNFLIQANFKPENKDEAIKQIFDQMNAIGQSYVSLEELEKAKKKLESSFAETAETASNLGDAVGASIILTNDLSSYTDYLPELKKLTLDDLKQAINKYLNIDNACVSVLIPDKN